MKMQDGILFYNKTINTMKYLTYVALFLILGFVAFYACDKSPDVVSNDFGIEVPESLQEVESRTTHPTVTLYFENPRAIDGNYVVDITATSDQDSAVIFGINYRIFYEANHFKSNLVLQNFEGSYGLYNDQQPVVRTGNAMSKIICDFSGAARFVNGIVQLGNSEGVYLSDTIRSKLFEMRLEPIGEINLQSPVVFDKMENPALGSFLPGSDGLTITIVVDPTHTGPTDEYGVDSYWTPVDPQYKYKWPMGHPNQ